MKFIQKQQLCFLVLAVIMLFALSCRLYRLLPPETGLFYAQDADEGVYATTAQLALQGYLPYRDFFTPMPPFAIYAFMLVLRIFYHQWGSPTGLMALRYASVFYGWVTVLFTFLAASLIGGKKSGLLAATIIATDGIVIAQDRRAMLESLTNMFSVVAILCYLFAIHQTSANYKPHRLIFLFSGAGLFSALALLSKGTAIVPVLVILLTIVLRRRWREGLWFGASFVGSYLLCAAVFLLTCPVEYIKQIYFFHLLRPWGGTVHPLARLGEIWNYPWSWTTVRLAIVGIIMTILAGRKVRNQDLWLIVLIWAALVLFLLLSSRTYWATYFSQLAVPLSILGGLSLNEEHNWDMPGLVNHFSVLSPQLWPSWQFFILAVVFGLGYTRLSFQYTATRAALEQAEPVYIDISAYIRQYLPADASILVFETNYTFLSSRIPAGAHKGSFFVDSYGEMLYRNLDIPSRTIPELLMAWVHQERVGTQEVFHRQPAQDEVLAVFSNAPYVILDQRALKQLSAETHSYIQSHTKVLKLADAVELRARLP